jgi:hypothetical protein
LIGGDVVGFDMEEVGVDGLFDFEGLKPVGGLSDRWYMLERRIIGEIMCRLWR